MVKKTSADNKEEEITIIQPDKIIKKSGNKEGEMPTHSKEYDLVGWEIYDYPYLSKMAIVEQPTREFAEKEYWKNIKQLKEWVEHTPVWKYPDGRFIFSATPEDMKKLELKKLSFSERIKIFPLYKWKKSLFNPYFAGWKEGYVPKK